MTAWARRDPVSCSGLVELPMRMGDAGLNRHALGERSSEWQRLRYRQGSLRDQFASGRSAGRNRTPAER